MYFSAIHFPFLKAGLDVAGYAGFASPARSGMELISSADNARTARKGASAEAPRFFLTTSTALSAEPIATLKNWKVGFVLMAGRHLLPSAWIIGTPGMVS